MNGEDEIRRLELLKRPLRLDLQLNDLRIIVNCFKAVAYQMEIDGEEYLDSDGLALKARLEKTYGSILTESLNREEEAPRLRPAAST